jgi:hypothetical protein
MSVPLDVIECACLPESSLPALADLRHEPGVLVSVREGRAWVRWGPENSAILERLRPIAGVELYARSGGLWRRLGHRLPSFGVPDDDEEGVPLSRMLIPLPLRPEPIGIARFEPVALTLVPDDVPRPASALECGVKALAEWAEMAPSAWLGSLQAAHSSDRVMIRGRRLPPLGEGRRFWGNAVLVPLGLRPEPDLPETALRAALGAGDEELLVLTSDGFEIVPVAAVRPLSRAGIRLAAEGRAP